MQPRRPGRHDDRSSIFDTRAHLYVREHPFAAIGTAALTVVGLALVGTFTSPTGRPPDGPVASTHTAAVHHGRASGHVRPQAVAPPGSVARPSARTSGAAHRDPRAAPPRSP